MRRVGLAVATGILASQFAFAQSDFEQYVERIRRSGMTEDAAGSLQMAASILSGATIFEVKEAPQGGLSRSYSGAACFRPGAEETPPEPPREPEGRRRVGTETRGWSATRAALRTLREKIEAKQEAWHSFLKKHADTDGSGFVSSEEGSAMRRRVELGALIAQLPHIRKLDRLVKVVQEERARMVEDLAAYANLQAESVREGLEGMPALPKDLSGAV